MQPESDNKAASINTVIFMKNSNDPPVHYGDGSLVGGGAFLRIRRQRAYMRRTM